MEDLQSGPISEFDFAEEPDDIPFEQERELLDLNVNKRAKLAESDD